VQNGGKLDLKLSATPAPTSLCLHLFSPWGGGGCLELLQKQQGMKYQPNWMGKIIETMDWGLTYKFRDNLPSFCKRNLALSLFLSLFISLSHLFCSFRLRLFCFVGDSAIRAEKR
jgi:hypothetical protein